MHTPGTLRIGQYRDIVTENGQKLEVIGVSMTCGHVPADDPCHDNARRLVACWNACEAINTETLEAMRLGDMRLDFAPDLLKMLDMMIWYYDAFREKSPVGPTERGDIALARKVLAAARGEGVTA